MRGGQVNNGTSIAVSTCTLPCVNVVAGLSQYRRMIEGAFSHSAGTAHSAN